MRTVKGARVSSKLTARKEELLAAGELAGHKYGCIHLLARNGYEFNPKSGVVTFFGNLCGCLTDMAGVIEKCHNCGENVKGATVEADSTEVVAEAVG